VIRHTRRQLEYISETGLDIKEINQRRYLKSLNIHYSRYSFFDKKWLLDSDIRTVIDIGANVGEFTAICAELFPCVP
jgi:hypothetical protein